MTSDARRLAKALKELAVRQQTIVAGTTASSGNPGNPIWVDVPQIGRIKTIAATSITPGPVTVAFLKSAAARAFGSVPELKQTRQVQRSRRQPQKKKVQDCIVTYCKAVKVEVREDPIRVRPARFYDFDLFIKQGPSKAIKVDRFTRIFYRGSSFQPYPSSGGGLLINFYPSTGPDGRLIVEALRQERNFSTDWGFTEEDGLDPFFERSRQAYLISRGKAIRNDKLKTWRTPYIERLFLNPSGPPFEASVGLSAVLVFHGDIGTNANARKGLRLDANNSNAGHIHDRLELATKPHGSKVEVPIDRQAFDPKILLPDRQDDLPDPKETKAYAYGLGLPDDWNEHFFEIDDENRHIALANYFEIRVTPPVF